MDIKPHIYWREMALLCWCALKPISLTYHVLTRLFTCCLKPTSWLRSLSGTSKIILQCTADPLSLLCIFWVRKSDNYDMLHSGINCQTFTKYFAIFFLQMIYNIWLVFMNKIKNDLTWKRQICLFYALKLQWFRLLQCVSHQDRDATFILAVLRQLRCFQRFYWAWYWL